MFADQTLAESALKNQEKNSGHDESELKGLWDGTVEVILNETDEGSTGSQSQLPFNTWKNTNARTVRGVFVKSKGTVTIITKHTEWKKQVSKYSNGKNHEEETTGEGGCSGTHTATLDVALDYELGRYTIDFATPVCVDRSTTDYKSNLFGKSPQQVQTNEVGGDLLNLPYQNLDSKKDVLTGTFEENAKSPAGMVSHYTVSWKLSRSK